MEYPALRRLAQDGESVAAAEASFALDVLDMARATGKTIAECESILVDRALHNLIGAQCQPQ